MKLTFEGSSLDEIFEQMATALGLAGGVGAAPHVGGPAIGAEARTAAQDAEKQVDANEKAGTPLPSAQKVLDEAGIPPEEYHKIDHSGRGKNKGRITKVDATAYVNMKRARELEAQQQQQHQRKAEPAPEAPKRDFPAPAEPAKPAPAAESAATDHGGEAPTEPGREDVPAATFPDAKSALTHLYSTKGMSTALAALQRFGAEKISALREEQYGEFIQYCRDIEAGKVDPFGGEPE